MFYKNTYQRMLWRDGKSLCERDGAALPVPLSDEENKFIADLNYHEDTWLGINDLETEGTFVDNDGEPITYSNWYRGEPNDLYGEDIAHIWGDSDRYPQWNDDNEAIRGSGYIKHVVCVYKYSVEPLDIKAVCDNSWNSAILSGEFEPVAVFGGKAIYQKQVADANGNYIVMYWDIITDRWMHWYFGRIIAPGFVWRGETMTEIVSNTPGEFQCMLSADLEKKIFQLKMANAKIIMMILSVTCGHMLKSAIIIQTLCLRSAKRVAMYVPPFVRIMAVKVLVIIGHLLENAIRTRTLCLCSARRVAMYVPHQHQTLQHQVNLFIKISNIIFER